MSVPVLALAKSGSAEASAKNQLAQIRGHSGPHDDYDYDDNDHYDATVCHTRMRSIFLFVIRKKSFPTKYLNFSRKPNCRTYNKLTFGGGTVQSFSLDGWSISEKKVKK